MIRRDVAADELLHEVAELLLAIRRSAPRTTNTPDNDKDEENNIPSFTFNRYMPRRRFVAITSALRFTSSIPPTYRDKFWEVREMIGA